MVCRVVNNRAVMLMPYDESLKALRDVSTVFDRSMPTTRTTEGECRQTSGSHVAPCQPGLDGTANVSHGVRLDADPGTEVTISGSLLFGAEGGNEVVSVTFSGVEAEVTTGDSETNVVAIVASGSAGQGDVVVTADSGATATATNGWEYIAEGEIEDVSPAFGQVGTIVVLTGSNLLGGGDNITTATLAGVEATVSE